jgi:hypothetical protein
LGAAARVVRIAPLEYSLETNKTPNTPRVKAATVIPVGDCPGRIETEVIPTTVVSVGISYEPRHQKAGDDRYAEGDGRRSQRQDLDQF